MNSHNWKSPTCLCALRCGEELLSAGWAHKKFPEEEERIWVHFPSLGTGLSSGGFCSPEHPVLMRSVGCVLIFWGYSCLYLLLYKHMSHQ